MSERPPIDGAPWRRTSGQRPDDALGLAATLREEIAKVVVGQDRLVQRLLVAAISGGHMLLQGPPGVAKTSLVRAFAEACALSFQRIQFTPDLMPADIIGTLVYNPRTLDFVTHRGPVFAHVILADEINRAPARVQSALLEVMQERSVTIGHHTHHLDEPFIVLATQNPADHEGTFPLPDAQLDRFLFQVEVGYPDRSEEAEILRRHAEAALPAVVPVVTRESLLAARDALEHVFVDPAVSHYVLDLVRASRDAGLVVDTSGAPALRNGVSPRGGVQLLRAARTTALLAGRDYVLPDDVRDVALDALRHRVALTADAEDAGMSTADAVTRIIAAVRCP